MSKPPHRHIAFVTGTRAEFGLMSTTLEAIRKHPKLKLSVIATGMHTAAKFRSGGDVKPDITIAWKHTRSRAAAMGLATAGLAEAFAAHAVDVVLVVGDRVEALAAACAATADDRVLAHVHGGDRAQGQADDSMRHAISKLAHVHLPATRQSATRLQRMGEDAWRIMHIGTPGMDGVVKQATRRKRPGPFVLVALHPVSADDAAEEAMASQLLADVRAAHPGAAIVLIDPNNDPGSDGIRRAWGAAVGVERHANLDRSSFLGLLRDAAVLVGNSSAGIIESGCFGTPVVDVGPRQSGREHGNNVRHVKRSGAALRRAISAQMEHGHYEANDVYDGEGTGRAIAHVLSNLTVDERLLRKVIRY